MPIFNIIGLSVQEKIFEDFYHIWEREPTCNWSCDRDHSYRLSFPLPYSVVKSGRNSNQSKMLCRSSLPASFKRSGSIATQKCFCLFGLRLYIPVNNFSVMSGQSHRFLGITSTFWEVNVSCSRIQHGDLSEDRTHDLSLQSLMLYH